MIGGTGAEFTNRLELVLLTGELIRAGSFIKNYSAVDIKITIER